MYDIQQIRADFPILGRTVYGKPLVYLDNGATTQKPRCVVEAITGEYYNTNANVHRGVHFLSQQATELHEASRETVRRFINARSTNEIVFTRGTTESVNLLAATFCQSQMQAGDEVIVSTMEHHSNIVPWQLQAMQRGIVLRVIPMDDAGNLLLDEYEKLFSARRTATAFPYWWTERRASPTCLSTYRRWMPTSTSSPATRSTVPPAWVCSTARRTGWTVCPPIRVEAR